MLIADHESGGDGDLSGGIVTQTTATAAVTATNPSTLTITAPNGVGSSTQPFVFNLGGAGANNSLTVNTSAFRAATSS